MAERVGQAPPSTAVKALDGQGRVGGYLVVWGDTDRRDLQGEYFTPDTDLGLDWYPRRPVLYHHGLDDTLGPELIGEIEVMRPDAQGVWVEAQLDLRNRWARAVLDLVERDALGWSSGSLPHLVAVEPDGHIRRWPIVEGSLTPTPAEPRLTDAVAVKAAFEALGLPTERILPREMDGAQQNQTGDEGMINEQASHGAAYGGDGIKRLPAAQTAPRPNGPAIEVRSKYAALDAVDMAFMHTWLSRSGQWTPSAAFMRELAQKTYRAVEQGKLDAGALRDLPVKADELMHTASQGFGQEWVPDVWSSELWRRATTENLILPLFKVIEMPSNPYEIAIPGPDPMVYFVPETQDEDDLTLGVGNPIPPGRFGTGKVTLTARKLALRVGFSSELVEDAVIPLMPLYREQAMRVMADALDNVLLNGDTETGDGNINSSDAPLPPTDKTLAFDGLRKLPLVIDPSKAHNALGNAPSLELMREARFKMPIRYALRQMHCAWIMDGSTYGKLLGLDEVLTVDKFGPSATVLSGELAKLEGVPIIVSPEMSTTQEDGLVGSSGNTQGQAVCVYRPGWVVGYRRRITATMDYLPYFDSYQMVATVRLAFGRMDDDVASALFNIGI